MKWSPIDSSEITLNFTTFDSLGMPLSLIQAEVMTNHHLLSPHYHFIYLHRTLS